MSLIDNRKPYKRCFVYCGPELCDCMPEHPDSTIEEICKAISEIPQETFLKIIEESQKKSNNVNN